MNAKNTAPVLFQLQDKTGTTYQTVPGDEGAAIERAQSHFEKEGRFVSVVRCETVWTSDDEEAAKRASADESAFLELSGNDDADVLNAKEIINKANQMMEEAKLAMMEVDAAKAEIQSALKQAQKEKDEATAIIKEAVAAQDAADAAMDELADAQKALQDAQDAADAEKAESDLQAAQDAAQAAQDADDADKANGDLLGHSQNDANGARSKKKAK